MNSDSCSWSEAKSSPLLCATTSRRGSAKRSRQTSPWTADWQCGCHFFLCTLPPQHSDLPFPACPTVHGKKVRLQEAGARQSRGAAGQGHLLLLHILAQAPALSGGYMVRRFPDPNSECQAQETGNVAPCGLLQKAHIIMMGPKQKLSFFYTVGPVVDLGFSCSGSKDRLTPSPPPISRSASALDGRGCGAQ